MPGALRIGEIRAKRAEKQSAISEGVQSETPLVGQNRSRQVSPNIRRPKQSDRVRLIDHSTRNEEARA